MNFSLFRLMHLCQYVYDICDILTFLSITLYSDNSIYIGNLFLAFVYERLGILLMAASVPDSVVVGTE